jgi:uroporphyrinogen decarboxylase
VALQATGTVAPRYAGIGYNEYHKRLGQWVAAHRALMLRFPEAVWVPGPVYEVGLSVMALAYGARCRFSDWRTPEAECAGMTLRDLADAPPADPAEQGLMPLVLAFQRQIEEQLAPEGLNRGFAYSWGPMSIAASVLGIPSLMTAVMDEPGVLARVLDSLTTASIRWLQAQYEVLRAPSGIFIGNDMTGMISDRHCRDLVLPCLRRMADAFAGVARVYHNDTPCPHLIELLADTGFDVWHFSHELPVALIAAKAGGRIMLMGNVAPLALGMNGTPDAIRAAAGRCLADAPPRGLILSWGGGMAGETPAENVDALIQAARIGACKDEE